MKRSWREIRAWGLGGLCSILMWTADPGAAKAVICEGDFNGDGAVNVGDLSVFAAAFGSTNSAPNYNAVVDFDGNGVVNVGDLSIFASEFGRTDCQTGSHSGRFVVYEGSKTCMECHLTETLNAHASVHYQWQGPTPYVVNLDGGGKLGAINDFCTYPDINFIGILTNVDGVQVDGGCAQCHPGLGLKPDPVPTTAQLENIDCLVCHSDGYERKVAMVNGNLRFVPAPEQMSVPLVLGVTDIHLPSRDACIECHSYAGGGCNNKRGDLEDVHRNPPTAMFDVHMASVEQGGAGLDCLDCHRTQNHRIAGRGTDLRPTDLNGQMACDQAGCHPVEPHGVTDLDRHTARVNCTVCHIPFFAKIASTDMVRDYSLPAELDVVNRLYEPHIIREANVVPEYRFFNGLSFFYNFGTPAVPGDTGRVVMAGVLGDVTDPNAKIYALKHHLGNMARDMDTSYLIPLRMGLLFQTGDVPGAIVQGANAVGWPLNSGYDFVPVERYMGLYHQVSPAGWALFCNDCHNGGTRLDFDALGYTPLPARQAGPTCASGCHGDKSDKWSPAQFFTRMHQKHVDGEEIDCSACHIFTAAN